MGGGCRFLGNSGDIMPNATRSRALVPAFGAPRDRRADRPAPCDNHPSRFDRYRRALVPPARVRPETLRDSRPVVVETRDHLDIVVTEPCDDPYKVRPETDAPDRAGRRPAWTRMRKRCRRTVPKARPPDAVETGGEGFDAAHRL